MFAVGDAARGTSSVIEAIASGRKGAMAVDRYLGGSGDIDEQLAPPETYEPWLGPAQGFGDQKRCREYRTDPVDRVKDFCGVVHSLEKGIAVEESQRCLQCDLRLRITPVRFWGDY